MDALNTKRPDQDEKKRVIVLSPTHAEGEQITAAIRSRLKEAGKLDREEKTFDQLVQLGWSALERGDMDRYDGTEIMKFHRNSGTFKAGQIVRIADWKQGDYYKSPEHFSVYKEGKLSLAAGDPIRITANGKSADGHDLNNKAVYKVKGFDRDDNIILDNGWKVAKDCHFLRHGYVATTMGGQGKTVDRVLISMGRQSIRLATPENIDAPLVGFPDFGRRWATAGWAFAGIARASPHPVCIADARCGCRGNSRL